MAIVDKLKDPKYVAFLDVLGFKDLVRSKSSTLDSYFDAITDAVAEAIHYSPEIKKQLISDSTILSIQVDQEAFTLFLRAIQTIQARCAIENIWIRGGVSIGDIYFDEDLKVVVGNGLINAYLLEQYAIFPRVIVDPRIIIEGDFKTRENFMEYCSHNPVTDPDSEGGALKEIPLISAQNDAMFVNYAGRIFVEHFSSASIVFKHIRNGLYSGQVHYPKYIWLKNYCIDTLSALGTHDHFSEEKRKELHILLNEFKSL